MCFICLTSSWPIYLNPYLNITPYWTKPITHLSLPPAPIMAAQFLKESGGGTVQVETRECREKNDQAKAKHAEQWANLASQVGPLLLGNMNTVVLFLKKQKKTYFSLIWWGPFLDIYYYFYYHLYIFFSFLAALYSMLLSLYNLCASLIQAILLLLVFCESKSAQNGCLSFEPLSSSKHNNTAWLFI